MEGLCLLHNTRTCNKKRTIAHARISDTIRVAMAYDWGTHSDYPALIWEELETVFCRLRQEFPGIKFNRRVLRGKDGSIYCDICRQICSSDALVTDLSTNNLNIILELGVAIGAGANIFILRSKHYKQRKDLSGLNGILEYRFPRRAGRMKFGNRFTDSLERKLRSAARHHVAARATAEASPFRGNAINQSESPRAKVG